MPIKIIWLSGQKPRTFPTNGTLSILTSKFLLFYGGNTIFSKISDNHIRHHRSFVSNFRPHKSQVSEFSHRISQIVGTVFLHQYKHVFLKCTIYFICLSPLDIFFIKPPCDCHVVGDNDTY